MTGNAPVVIEAGSTVRFPVATTSPFAPYQQLKPLAEIPDVSDLAIARTLTASNPKLTATQLNAAIGSILSAAGTSQVTTINLPPDFHVEAGATLVLAGPITVISAQNFYVDGTVIAHGSLNIKCQAFGARPQAGKNPGTPPVKRPFETPINPLTPP